MLLPFFVTLFNTTIEENYHLVKDIYQQIEPFKKRRAGALSGGMKQKLAIISALIHKPKVLLLDEPFVGLDPKAALDLKNMMHEMCEEGCAIFFSTHVLEVAEKLCNKIAIIKAGRLVESGEMETVVQNQSLEEVFMEVVENEQS